MEFNGTVSLDPVTSGAFWAAYKALGDNGIQLAQVRADLAERIVTTLRECHQFAAVEVLLANWPAGYTRLNRTVLSEVVIAAARVLASGGPSDVHREDMTISRHGRGTCPVCSGSFSLRKDGTVGPHGAGITSMNDTSGRCRGWKQKPRES